MEAYVHPDEILEKVRNLVKFKYDENTPIKPEVNSLHKGIVKLYFEARNVEIDYKNKIIKAEIPVSTTEYTGVSFECLDLTQFLNSCIKKDKKSITFYQNVLTYYNHLEVA
ncbi:MAG TPA: hypothetical protein VFM60_06725 [Salinimicrobium sp.]|nr:hypothetical protein [Salinimicrobium sp.]